MTPEQIALWNRSIDKVDEGNTRHYLDLKKSGVKLSVHLHFDGDGKVQLVACKDKARLSSMLVFGVQSEDFHVVKHYYYIKKTMKTLIHVALHKRMLNPYKRGQL